MPCYHARSWQSISSSWTNGRFTISSSSLAYPTRWKKTRVTLPSLKTFAIDRKGTRYWVDETELSDIKQAMDMIPDLLLLLESNEITMTPPLVAGKLLCFPLPSVNAEQVLNQWMGWNHSRIHQIIQRSHTTVSHLALRPNFVQLFLLCPPSWYMYSDHPPHQVAYSAILLLSWSERPLRLPSISRPGDSSPSSVVSIIDAEICEWALLATSWGGNVHSYSLGYQVEWNAFSIYRSTLCFLIFTDLTCPHRRVLEIHLFSLVGVPEGIVHVPAFLICFSYASRCGPPVWESSLLRIRLKLW